MSSGPGHHDPAAGARPHAGVDPGGEQPGRDPSGEHPGVGPSGDPRVDGADAQARQIVTTLAGRGQTVAAAESITGGLVTAALTTVPGSSAVLRGGVVAYATDLKVALLGVDPVLLAQAGPVDARVAAAMATGVRERLDATYGVATTGEAGPDSASGQPVGTLFVAVGGPDGCDVVGLTAGGARPAVRAAAVRAALDLLAACLARPLAEDVGGLSADRGNIAGPGRVVQVDRGNDPD